MNLNQMQLVAAAQISDDVVRARLEDETGRVKSLSIGASAAGGRVHTLPTKPKDWWLFCPRNAHPITLVGGSTKCRWILGVLTSYNKSMEFLTDVESEHLKDLAMGHCSYSDRQIADADGIFAVDPVSGKGIQLWGQECCAGPGPTSGGFRMLRSLEVEVDDLATEAMLSLIAQIERVKRQFDSRTTLTPASP
jgi:hypothetical protein